MKMRQGGYLQVLDSEEQKALDGLLEEMATASTEELTLAADSIKQLLEIIRLVKVFMKKKFEKDYIKKTDLIEACKRIMTTNVPFEHEQERCPKYATLVTGIFITEMGRLGIKSSEVYPNNG